MTLPVIAASVFLLLQTAKGSIEGVVVNSMTNKPIPGAQVNATRMPAVATGGPAGTITTGVVGGVIGVAEAGRVITAQGPLNPPVQIPPVTTDTNGHFVFADLEPGRYLLRAAAEGYARQEYSTRPGDQNGMTAQVELSAGQTSKETILHLIPGGTVSGRVTGSNGEPLVNIEVSLLRSTYDGDGRKTLQQSGAAQTNDRGEYRLFWVTPGRYYLSA